MSEPKRGWFQRLTEGLGKSSKQMGDQIAQVFVAKEPLTQAKLDELEEMLIEADLGPHSAARITERFAAEKFGKDVDETEIRESLSTAIGDELSAREGVFDPMSGPRPYVVLFIGVNGSGKTTTLGKVATDLKRRGAKVLVVAGDTFRAAAVEQLRVWGERTGCHVVERPHGSDAAALAYDALVEARTRGADVLLVDTAGRLAIDEAMMQEVRALHAAVKPIETLFVVDSMQGQDAVNVARAFNEALPLTGIVLTKLDGDARGGAALSIASITGKPVMFASAGEKLTDFDLFHPDRMASRILGMGDVLTLIEKAEAAVEEDEQAAMEARMRAGQFTFDDFLAAQKMLKKMGPLQGVLKMIPGIGNQLKDVDIDERQLARVEAIVLSMTPKERSMPHLIDGSRRKRIAAGSGQTIQEVNELLTARKKMEKMMKQMGKGKMPTLPGQLTKTGRR